jgi:hypothetical protein
MRIAKKLGYDEVEAHGTRCPEYECNHAFFRVRGKEFSNWTIIDFAAAAAEGYGINSHWCNDPTESTKWPNWIPSEW